MAFPTVHILGVVASPLLPARGRVDRLAIYAGCGPWRVGFLLSPYLATQRVMDSVQGSIVPPLVKVPPGRRPGWEVCGEVSPLAAGTEDVKDGIDDIAEAGRARPPSRGDGDVRLDESPLFVGDVAGARLGSHRPFYALNTDLWDRH